MKKLLSLSIAALTLYALCVSAFAAESGGAEIVPVDTTYPLPSASTLYPSEITEYAEGTTPRISKVYLLTADDNPASIPTADFDREGCTYTAPTRRRRTPNRTLKSSPSTPPRRTWRRFCPSCPLCRS